MNCLDPNLTPLAFGSIRLDYFSPWTALGLFAALGSIIVLLGMKSLSGLGPVRKWVAIGIRLLVLLLIILILGDIKWIRQNSDVEVMIVRQISRSTELVKDHPGQFLQKDLDDFLTEATKKENSPSYRETDKVGEISFNERPIIDAVPAPILNVTARAVLGAGTGTDAAAAVQLGLASMDNDAMHRLLLIWDGNSTAGDLNAALAAAASQHVPIDVFPLKYNVKHEVMMDKFIAPTWRQEGQPFTIEVHIVSTNTQDVIGNLSVTNNGQLMDLKDGKTTERVTLHNGRNVVRIQVPPQTEGVHQFHATVDGISNVTASISNSNDPPATQLDNKSADIFTFVKGKGKVLLVDNTNPEDPNDVSRSQYFMSAMQSQKIDIDRFTPAQFPDAVQLQQYLAVVLANVPRGAGGLNDEQDRMLASYVHDSGGGLVMIGGPDTFGAGGWEGSHLEQELPVTMEVPAQRQIPKGALVLCMDPAEAPQGNYWGEQCAIKATEALSSRDDIGIISYGWSNLKGGGMGGMCKWDSPLAPKGDGSKVIAAIKSWGLSDLPSFQDAVDLALHGENGHGGLLDDDARARHIIIITDDDPSMPNEDTIQLCIKNKITISTITIFPHHPGNIAPGVIDVAKRTGGRNYGPFEGSLNQLPQIFIKEATVVKRTIIQENPDGIPVTLNLSTSELVKGLPAGPMPAVTGMDLVGKRDNPLVQTPMVAGPKADPLLATWQAGLGKTAVFTSDAFPKWDARWTPQLTGMADSMYAKFWTQVVRGVARSPVNTDFETEMTTDGDKGHIVVHAQKDGNAFNNFLSIEGNIGSGPELKQQHVRLQQTGPGIYEGDFDASEEGSYIGIFQYQGESAGGQSGTLMAGTAVNSSPEFRNLQSNDAILNQIAERTGGRVLNPWDVASADLFSRDGLEITQSPKAIWDLLLPVLMGLLIVDVAVRRIAWNWLSTKRLAASAASYVRQFTVNYQKVDNRQTLDNLRRVREEVADQKFKPAASMEPVGAGAAGAATSTAQSRLAAEPRPDRSAKFEAGNGVEGDIATLVGGASDKPIPSAPKKIEPKGGMAFGEHTGGLLEAKRRAQQKIKEKESG